MALPMEFLQRSIKAMWIISVLALLGWPGQLKAQENSPVDFEADSVTVNQQDDTMIATGNVTILQNNETLRADEVIYNPSSETARAIGNVVITTLDGVTHYADEMTLDENFTHAIARPLLTKLSDGTRFSADSGEYTQNKRTVFDRSIFSPCKCNYDKGESPIWDLRASRSIHDVEKPHHIPSECDHADFWPAGILLADPGPS